MNPDKRFGWHWYSICSMHQTRHHFCQLCAKGQWVGPVQRLRSWYWRKTHHVVNGQWEKKSRPALTITTIEGKVRTGRHPKLVSKNTKVGRSRFR